MIKLESDKEESNQLGINKMVDLIKDIINEINSFYNLIKMQIDGIYNPIILISKKKYVGSKLLNLS